MVDAVIVSTARTPIGRAVRGAFNLTHGADMGGHVVAQAVKRAGIDPGDVEDVTIGCANPEGATGGNVARQCAHPRRPAGHGGGPDHQPLLLLGPAGDRAGRAQHHPGWRAGGGGGRLGVHQPRADEPQHQVLPQRVDRRAQGRALHADDRDRRHRRAALRHLARKPGRVLPHQPAAHRRGAEGGAAQRRDRADDHGHAGGEQGDQGDLPAHRHAGARRGQPPRHHARGPRQAEAGARGRTSSSPPAMPASSPTAPAPVC